jgi:hypothetical protein
MAYGEWRDFVVDHNRNPGSHGGCRSASLGAALAETEPEARAWLRRPSLAGRRAFTAGFLQMHELGRLAPEADPRQLALATLPRLKAAHCSPGAARLRTLRPRSTQCLTSSRPSAAPRALRSATKPSDRPPTRRCPPERGLPDPQALEMVALYSADQRRASNRHFPLGCASVLSPEPSSR